MSDRCPISGEECDCIMPCRPKTWDKPAKPAILEGYEVMTKFPPGEAVVSLIQYQTTALVATTKGVYRLVDGRFEPLEFLMLKDAT